MIASLWIAPWIAPALASPEPGMRIPGVQYGCSIRPWLPGGTLATILSNMTSAGTPSAPVSPSPEPALAVREEREGR